MVAFILHLFFSFFYVVTVPAVVGLMAFVFLSWLGLFLLFQCICYDPFFFLNWQTQHPNLTPKKKLNAQSLFFKKMSFY